MTNVLRLAIVDPVDDSRETLKSMLLGMDIVWLEAECSRYEFFSDVVAQTNPDIGVVVLDENPEKALELIESITATNPECSVLAVSSSTDGQIILQAMRAGAKEFLTQPVVVEDLMLAMERIGNSIGGSTGEGVRSSSIVAIAGATGGVGVTSLGVNLGCVLASNPANTVALVDLDLTLGDADVFLDTIPDYTLVDVAQNVSRLDFTLLKRSLTKHSSGLYLLPRPVQLQDAGLITPDDFHRVLGLLKATFSHVIVDLSKSFSSVDLVAMQSAEHVLLVTQLDLPCLRNIVRLMMSFEEEKGLKDKVHLVVNRAGLSNGQISLKKAQETVGRDVYWQLPNDYRVMIEMRNNGVPLIEQAPKAAITQSIVGLAERLFGSGVADEEPEQAKAEKSSWLSFLSKAKKS